MTIISEVFDDSVLAALTISFSDGKSGTLKFQAQEDIKDFWRVKGYVNHLDDASETVVNKPPSLDVFNRTLTVETTNILWYVKELGGKLLPQETVDYIIDKIMRAQIEQEKGQETTLSYRPLTCRG